MLDPMHEVYERPEVDLDAAAQSNRVQVDAQDRAMYVIRFRPFEAARPVISRDGRIRYRIVRTRGTPIAARDLSDAEYDALAAFAQNLLDVQTRERAEREFIPVRGRDGRVVSWQRLNQYRDTGATYEPDADADAPSLDDIDRETVAAFVDPDAVINTIIAARNEVPAEYTPTEPTPPARALTVRPVYRTAKDGALRVLPVTAQAEQDPAARKWYPLNPAARAAYAAKVSAEVDRRAAAVAARDARTARKVAHIRAHDRRVDAAAAQIADNARRRHRRAIPDLHAESLPDARDAMPAEVAHALTYAMATSKRARLDALAARHAAEVAAHDPDAIHHSPETEVARRQAQRAEVAVTFAEVDHLLQVARTAAPDTQPEPPTPGAPAAQPAPVPDADALTPDQRERAARVLDGCAVVANVKTDAALIEWAQCRNAYTYAGRPSLWGNPFTMRTEADRAERIRQHRAYLATNTALRARAARDLRGRVLGCYCYPRPCHCDALAEVANAARA